MRLLAPMAPPERLHRHPVAGSPWFAAGRTAPPGLADLRAHPWDTFVPVRTRRRRRLLVVESGGTTGRPTAVAFTPRGFHRNFVAPFLAAVRPFRRDFTGPWLFAGPSGPHAIGLGALGCALHLSRCSPASVDFDPRWVRRLAPGVARERYLDHVVDQALELWDRRRLRVLFSTPPLLLRLASRLDAARRAAITGLHWGGVAADAPTLDALRDAWPRARLLGGFGNSLVGLFPQVGEQDGLPVYSRRGGSQGFAVVRADGTPVGSGEAGRLLVSRCDETLLAPGLEERDRVRLVGTPGGGWGFTPVPAPEAAPSAEVIY